GSLSVEGMTLAGADILPEQYVPPKGFFVLLEVEDPSEAERLFMKLSEGGSVEMPVQQTFWSIRFGMLIDRFGIPWEINCVQEVE
ncbi:MAG: VOC family protein, partial [Candidatus Hydrogenedentota bacterium]